MSSAKVTKKKNIRPKSEVAARDISQPFGFKHDLHVGSEVFNERLVNVRTVQPPTPCPAYTINNSSGDSTIPSDAASLHLREEIIPTLSKEICQVIEDTVRRFLRDGTVTSQTPHCQTCTCSKIRDIKEAGDKSEKPGYLRKASISHQTKGKEVFPINSNDEHVGDNLVQWIGGEMITVKHILDHIEETILNSSISNPLYYQTEKPSSVQRQKYANLTKYGSDQQIKQCGKPQDEITRFLRTQTLPVARARQTSELEEEIKTTRKESPLSDYDQRECMAHALQWHVHDLVDGVIVTESELPDSLIRDGCLTEEECSTVRQRRDRRDQVRVLLRVIKGRDMSVLVKFLQHIRSHNKDVAQKVQIKYEQNIRDGMRCSKCARCQLTAHVNLKYMADSLWRYSLIDEDLYNLITETSNPTGAQGELWKRVIGSLNHHRSSVVKEVLLAILTEKNHYCHIAKGVEKALDRHGELRCLCECRIKMNRPRSVTSSVSTKSPQTSETEFRVDSESDISRLSIRTGYTNASLTVRGQSEVSCVDSVVTKASEGLRQDDVVSVEKRTDLLPQACKMGENVRLVVTPRTTSLMKQNDTSHFELEATEV